MNLKFSLLTGSVLALSLLSTGGFSQNLTVNLTEVLSEKGQLMVAVYNKQDHWLSDKPTEIFAQKIISLEGQITNKTLQFTLELPEGEYALYLFQDKDNNGELKSNWIGIPKEPVGTSNNAKGTMGPPKYKDARFQIASEDIVQNIILANMD